MPEYKIILGYTSIVLSLALAIFCMSTYGWVTYEGSGFTLSIGLKNYQVSYDNGGSQSGAISDLPDNTIPDVTSSNLNNGGTGVIVCGSFGSFFCVTAGIFFFLSLSRPFAWYRWGAIGFAYLAGVMFVIGCVVYAKAYNLDYSFILCTFCSFGYLLAATIMLTAGTGITGSAPPANNKPPPQQFDG